MLLAATTPGTLHSSARARRPPDLVIGTDRCKAIDTLLVARAPNEDVLAPSETTLAWPKRTVPKARRFGSVGAEAFMLAATGLLDGKRITTHWAVAAKLAAAYPRIRVDEDAIFVRDGRVRTAAGVTAGLDLALALVEEDLGRELAMKVAAQLVMFFKRPGGQLQFSRKQQVAVSGRSALQELQRWVFANPALDHRVAHLAQRLQLSPRHFSRLFKAALGVAPAH